MTLLRGHTVSPETIRGRFPRITRGIRRIRQALRPSRFTWRSLRGIGFFFIDHWGTILVLAALTFAGIRISQFKYDKCTNLQFIGHADEAAYIQMGQSLASGRGLNVDYVSFYFLPYPRDITHREDHWPPFLAFIHAIFFKLCGISAHTTRLAPIVLGTLVLPLLTAGLAIALSGRSYVGLVAGAMMLAQPLIFGESIVGLSDLPMAMLVTGFLWATIAARKVPWMHLIAGFFAALAFYAKGSQLILLPLYPLLAILICGPRVMLRKWLWLGLTTALLLIAPWLISNQRNYGSPLHSTQNYVSGYMGLEPWEQPTYSIYWGHDSIGPLPKTSDRWTKYWRLYWPETAKYREQFTQMFLTGPEMDRSAWHQFGQIGTSLGNFVLKPPAMLRHPLLWFEGKPINEPMVRRSDAVPSGSATDPPPHSKPYSSTHNYSPASPINSTSRGRRSASRTKPSPKMVPRPAPAPALDADAVIPGNHLQRESFDLWKPLSQWKNPDLCIDSTTSLWFLAVLISGAIPMALATFFWRRYRRRVRQYFNRNGRWRWKWVSRGLGLGCLLCVAACFIAFAIELRAGNYIAPLAAGAAIAWLASEWVSITVLRKRWMLFPLLAIFIVLLFEWGFVVYFWQVIQRFAYVFVPPLAAIACVAASRILELPFLLLWPKPPAILRRHAPRQLSGLFSLILIIFAGQYVYKHRDALADSYTAAHQPFDTFLSTYHSRHQYSEAGSWIKRHIPNAIVMCRDPWELKFYCAATNKTVEVPYANAKAIFAMAQYYHVTHYLNASRYATNVDERPALWPLETGQTPGLKLIHTAGDKEYRLYQIEYDKLK